MDIETEQNKKIIKEDELNQNTESFKCKYTSMFDLKLGKFKCDLRFREQEKSNNHIIYNFEKVFPNLFNFIDNFDIGLSEYSKSENYEKEVKKFIYDNLPLFNEELEVLLGDAWNNLDKNSPDKTKIHTILVILFINLEMKLLDPLVLSKYSKNVLYWAALLHDIAKYVNINVYQEFKEKGDKIHPFKSGAVSLKIFNKLGLVESEVSEQLYDLLLNSFEIDTRKTELRYIHSLLNIKEIIQKLKQLDKFVYEVLVLVIFHQSLPNIEEKMNKPLLSIEDINIIFDFRLFELMRILMINDSAAHSLFLGLSYSQEINNQLNKINII